MAAPSDVVRIGMIGLGGRGNALMASEVKRVPNARVTHLCDVDQARLEKAQASAEKLGYGKVRGTDDMRRLLDDKEVDAVVIATPDHWHAPAAILACAAGKDVYVEKPVSHNLREGRLMIEAARKYNRVVQAGLQSRSRPSTIAAIELAHSGKLGKVLMAKAWNTQLRADIARLKPRPEVEFLAGLSTDAVVKRLRELDRRDVLFTPGYFTDGAGRQFTTRNSNELIVAASGAPVYGPFSPFVGSGMVGGVMPSFADMRRSGARVSLSGVGKPSFA
jgi:hypothetical protein